MWAETRQLTLAQARTVQKGTSGLVGGLSGVHGLYHWRPSQGPCEWLVQTAGGIGESGPVVGKPRIPSFNHLH